MNQNSKETLFWCFLLLVLQVLTFQKCCHFQLSATNDLDKSNISVIAAQVKEKAVKNCEDGETMYKVHFGSG